MKTEWGLLFLLALLFPLLRPIDDLDLFTQIKLGERFFQSFSFYFTEPFTYLNSGNEVANPGWLAQVIFALLHKTGTWAPLRIFAALIIALSMILALKLAKKDAALHNLQISFCSLLAALLLALLVTGSNNGVRPQIFSLLGFSILMLLRESTLKLWQRLALLTPVLLVWQNSHPSLVIGLVWILTNGVSQFFQAQGAQKWSVAIDTSVFLLYSAIFIFLTPLGTEILTVSQANFYISRELLRVSEWLPAWDSALDEAMLGFWFAAACSAPLFLFQQGLHSNRRALEFFIFLGLAIYSARLSLYFALVALSVWPHWLAELPAFNTLRRLRIPNFSMPILIIIGVFATILTVSSVGPVADDVPLSQACKISRLSDAGRIYNYREWGGLLAYCGVNNNRIMIDGRLYLHSDEIWKRYMREAAGMVVLDEIVKSHLPQVFFLQKDFHQELIKQLRNFPAFELAFEEQGIIAFNRR